MAVAACARHVEALVAEASAPVQLQKEASHEAKSEQLLAPVGNTLFAGFMHAVAASATLANTTKHAVVRAGDDVRMLHFGAMKETTSGLIVR